MTISAKIIADSRCVITGKRLTTMQVRYPRIIHAEFMTHRLFSRNASSSRAVPVAKLIEEARNETAMPVRFGANQRGMQDKGGHYDALIKSYPDKIRADLTPEQAWKIAAENAARAAEAFEAAGYHKQIANRLLEPFTHINVVVSATEWTNFFALRRHEDADPTMRALADAMWEAMQASTPRLLLTGEWHMPYVSDEERLTHTTEQCLVMSAARCARVSYNKHDGSSPFYEDDRKLYDRLVTAELVHASPLEHQGKPDPWVTQPELWGNFEGFIQYRKTVPNEAIK